MDHDGLFGPVGLLSDDMDKLQNALDGVDGGDAVIRPGRVVEVQDVPTLVSLQRDREEVLGEGGSAACPHSLSPLTYPSLNFLTVHSGDSDSDSISTLTSPYITGSSLNGQ